MRHDHRPALTRERALDTETAPGPVAGQASGGECSRPPLHERVKRVAEDAAMNPADWLRVAFGAGRKLAEAGGKPNAVMAAWRIAGAVVVLGVAAASPVAAQDVLVVFHSGVSNNRAYTHIGLVPRTFDIAAETLTISAAFESRTVADRAAGRDGGFVFCRYRNRKAVTVSGTSSGGVYWLGCTGKWPEPQTFERLGATDGKGGERRGGVSVTISEDGRTYEMSCEDTSSETTWGETVTSGRSFDCWLLGVSPAGRSERLPGEEKRSLSAVRLEMGGTVCRVGRLRSLANYERNTRVLCGVFAGGDVDSRGIEGSPPGTTGNRGGEAAGHTGRSRPAARRRLGDGGARYTRHGRGYA